MEIDRKKIREKFKKLLARGEVREALWHASPDLFENIPIWMSEPGSERGERIELALYRYLARMAARPTPFGLFSGCSTGSVGGATELTLPPRSAYARHTRLDMEALYAVLRKLAAAPAMLDKLAVRANSSLYALNGRLNYAESHFNGERRTNHLVAVEETEPIASALAKAENGATAASIASAIVEENPRLTADEAREFVGDLVATQVLVPEPAPPITGGDPARYVAAKLQTTAETRDAGNALARVCDALRDIDARGVGQSADAYREPIELMKDLAPEIKRSHLFQIDLTKPPKSLELSDAVCREFLRGSDILRAISLFRKGRGNPHLERFRSAFQDRYEGKETPLHQALDEESGIGFGPWSVSGLEASPLIEGLSFGKKGTEDTAWGERESYLFRRLEETVLAGGAELALDGKDLEKLKSDEAPGFPDAFGAFGTLLARSPEALAKGEYRILLTGTLGPTAALMFARFCHADARLREATEKYLRAEEAFRPGAIFAEIVHLPQDRYGNFICRPLLRQYEIPYLGRSGAPPEFQIPITDLMVSVSGGRVTLRSRKLGKEIIPRLSNAHSYMLFDNLPIYQFLCALQEQDAAHSGWSWGPLAGTAPFLPRVTHGRFVFDRARWRILKEELPKESASAAEIFKAVRGMKEKKRMPDLVWLVEADHVMPFDLRNALAARVLVHMIRAGDGSVLVEGIPGEEDLCVSGPEGKFTHELVIPFVRSDAPAGPGEAREPRPQAVSREIPRRFPPGSEWLYAKLYAGTLAVDKIIGEIRPLVEELIESSVIDRWFFIRYGDPSWHARIRFHGDPSRLMSEALPRLEKTIRPLIGEGTIWRFQLDTYEREVERYGGAGAMPLAEEIFHADSDFAAGILDKLLPGEEGEDARWRLALAGVDRLFSDCGMDLKEKRAAAQALSDSYMREFDVIKSKPFKDMLAEKLRKHRKDLEMLLDYSGWKDHPLSPGLEPLEARSKRLAPAMEKLKGLDREGGLNAPLRELAKSYAHMHVNRVLRAAHRAQELVIYSFLSQIYHSLEARK